MKKCKKTPASIIKDIKVCKRCADWLNSEHPVKV